MIKPTDPMGAVQEIASRLHYALQDAVYEELKAQAAQQFLASIEPALREAARTVTVEQVTALHDQMRLGKLIGVDVRINGSRA